jgi:hypothetical protein
MSQDSPQKRSRTNKTANPYRTVSASERRARREARDSRRPRRDAEAASTARAATASIPQEMINELLANPTKVVTEEDLRHDYSYVIADLRSMALLAGGLIVLLFILAFALPR